MSLPNLASELQDIIISNLHPTAALALGATNRHYHETVTLHRLPVERARRFLFDLETSPNNIIIRKDTYDEVKSRKLCACFTCLRALPCINFAYEEMIASCADTYEDHRFKRQCMNCDLKQGRIKTGAIYYCWCDYIVMCNGCSKVQQDFCRGCRFCDRCLKEERALQTCDECGWCDKCIDEKTMEWNLRQEGKYDGNDAKKFQMMDACDNHVPGFLEATEGVNEYKHNEWQATLCNVLAFGTESEREDMEALAKDQSGEADGEGANQINLPQKAPKLREEVTGTNRECAIM